MRVCSLAPRHVEFCKEVEEELRLKGWEVETDLSDSSLNKKVRNAQIKQFNYILVVGDEETETNTVDVRSREGQRLGKLDVAGLEKIMSAEYPENVPLPNRKYPSSGNENNNE